MMKKQSMDVAHNSVQSLLRYITDPAKPSHWRTKTMKNLPDRIGPCTGIFWWDDHIPLFEFSLLQGDFEEPRGYVIASSSEALPPIIEYSLEGLTYSQKLHSYITTLLASRNILYSQISWY